MSHKLTNLASEYIEYLDEQIKRKKKSWQTGQLTRRAFKKLIMCIGDIDLQFLSVEHAERFQNWMLDRYEKTSVNMYMKTLGPAFNWAANRRHWIKEGVFKVPLLKITKKRMRIYKPHEFNAMLLAAPNDMWRGRLLCGHDLGMRRSEVMHLIISDIDYDRGEIHIQPKKETQTTLAWEPKDRDCRVLPMIDRVSKTLLKIQNELPAGQPYLLLSDFRYYRVMQLRRQGKLSERIRLNLEENFTKPFDRILQRANVPHGTFHDLRKTYLTELAESGLPQHWLQELAGHSDPQTTRNYYISVRRNKMLSETRFLLNLMADEQSYDPITLGLNALEL